MEHRTHTPGATLPAPLSAAGLTRTGDHEHLFQLLEELGPAPDAFMLGVSDPWIGREDLFGDWGTEAGA